MHRNELNRREFLRFGAAGGLLALAGEAPPPAPAALPAFELEEATLEQLQEAMRSGRHTAASLARAYLERIEALDRQGPALRHMLDLNPDALEVADRLDRERAAGRVRGPLHGIPVLLKDNIDTADRMTTTAGSLALEGSIPSRDSFVAQRLREAGAVLLGKTNLSEWANFRSTRSSSGWSARGGQGRNPYAPDRSACGSSSGSGGAIAASYAAVAVGTETDGSVTCPAALCSLVGIKPTLGLVSRAGIIPIAHSQDTAGPMARTVADAAILLGALAGPDPRDPITAAARERGQADYTRFLDPEGLRGARIGVARKGLFGYSPEADRVAEEALEAMRRAGAVIVDPADVPHVGEYGDSEFTVLLYEFKHDLNEYLRGLGPGAPIRSLRDAIEFNERNREREMPFFGQEIFYMAEEKGPLTEKEYLDALARNQRLAGPEGIDRVMREHRLDALVAPTTSPAWTIDLVNGDHYLGSASTPAAVAGYPHVTVPAGYSHGLPVGLSFFGRAWSEPTLIRLAYAFEQATRVRVPPRFGAISP
jgi:amidase